MTQPLTDDDAEQFEIEGGGQQFRIVPGAMSGDYIIETLRRNGGFYENDLLEWLSTLKLPEGRLIDGGAFVGNHTLYFAGVLGRHVTAYEPNPVAFDVLERHMVVNELSPLVTLRRAALGAERGRANLIDTPQSGNAGGTSIRSAGEGEVVVVALDDDLVGDDPVALVKLDVEGSETAALAGANRVIDAHRPLLLIECMSAGAFAEVRDTLAGKGYRPIGVHAATPVYAFAHAEKAAGYFADDRAPIFDRAYHDYRAYIENRNDSSAQARRALDLAARQTEASTRTANEIASSIAQVNETIARFRGEAAEAAEAHRHEATGLAAALSEAQSRMVEAEAAHRRALTDGAKTTEERDLARRALDASRQDVSDLRSQAQRLEAERDRSDARAAQLAVEADAYSSALAKARVDALALNARLKPYKKGVSALQSYAQTVRSSTALRVGLWLTTGIKRPDALIGKGLRRLTGRTRAIGDPTALPPSPPSMSVPRPEDLIKASRSAGRLAASTGVIRRKRRTGPFPVSDLRLALIADEFTRLNLGATCHVQNLTPDEWQAQIAGFEVDILFIESAWQGVEGRWHRKLQKVPPALQSILAAARAANVPVMFWNKEDPIHFKAWLPLAGLADHVFTTDIDRVPAYVAALGHDRVGVLPFACAPALTNPLADIPRAPGASFAGSYYHRYPERAADLDMLADLARKRGSLTIYDRNSEKNYADFRFPDRFEPYLRPALPFERIAEAYKGHEVGINMNSVRQSPTMFARRVYELMASNTLVLSNFSHGMRLLFGDLVVSGENEATLRKRLADLDDPEQGERLRVRALRKVLSEHTYAHRLSQAARSLGLDARVDRPTVDVLGSAATLGEAAAIAASFEAQEGVEARLSLRLTGDAAEAPIGTLRLPAGTTVSTPTASDETWRGERSEDDASALVAVFSPERSYGPSYLADLVLSRTYFEGDGATRSPSAAPYSQTDRATPSLSVFTKERAATIGTDTLFDDVAVDGDFLSIDHFNVGEVGQEPGSLDAAPLAKEGVGSGAIHAAANRRRRRALKAKAERYSLDGAALNEALATVDRDAVTFEAGAEGPSLASDLAADKHAYAWLREPVPIERLRHPDDDHVTVLMETTGGLSVQAVLSFLDEDGGKIAPALPAADGVRRVPVPDGTSSVRLGVRVQGAGTTGLRGFRFGMSDDSQTVWIPRADTLVLAQAYPSYDNIYRNGFVHRRVTTYWDEGMPCDVLRFDAREPVRRYEFENIDVAVGHEAELAAALASGAYKRVLVHFLDARMWSVLKPYLGKVEVTVWLHGSDVQPWHRREFNYADDAARERAIKLSAPREALWQDVFATIHPHLRFVFVADYARREIEDDYDVSFADDRFEVVHNFIDTDLFEHRPKAADQRFKVLSIRPFASRKYANDLTVEAILLLSEREGFENYAFRLVGDGELFDETVAPLRRFGNVEITQGFLRQPEIAELHRDYGVWLSPTRMDWQGVSRDEAMSSGLVPVTTDCTAIPEFVDQDCGFLCPPEDARAIADAIEMLANDAALFETLSAAAAERVRRQSSLDQTIKREIGIVRRQRSG